MSFPTDARLDRLVARNVFFVMSQESKMKMPGGCLCLLGAVLILFSLFCLVFDDMNGGPNEGSVFFWGFEALFVIPGLFAMVVGLIRWFKTANPKQ